MSEQPLAPKTYMIESLEFDGQYVSVVDGEAVVGNHKLHGMGNIQAVRLERMF